MIERYLCTRGRRFFRGAHDAEYFYVANAQPRRLHVHLEISHRDVLMIRVAPPCFFPATDRPWLVIVWNDPINLMDYVTYVFQQVFGYPRKKATKLMLDVHHKGKAVVAAGAREAMEHNVEVLHGYGLWATVKQDN